MPSRPRNLETSPADNMDEDEAGSLGDFIENDEGGDYAAAGGSNGRAPMRASPVGRYVREETKAQEAIQPGATPAGGSSRTEWDVTALYTYSVLASVSCSTAYFEP